MTAETESLMLEILKTIQGRTARMEDDLHDVKLRMSALEASVGNVQFQIGQLNSRMDRFDERMSRIERRLDLIEV